MILSGRQEIQDYFGPNTSWDKVQRKIQHGAPIKKDPSGEWVTTTEALDAWRFGLPLPAWANQEQNIST